MLNTVGIKGIPFISCFIILQLQQYGGCEVRTVDYGIYPDHVADTSNFAWRPIVIQVATLTTHKLGTHTHTHTRTHTRTHTHTVVISDTCLLVKNSNITNTTCLVHMPEKKQLT